MPDFLKSIHDGHEEVHILHEPEVIVGRRSDSQILILDPYVSRHHAKLVRGEDGYRLVDLKSTHGTFVNGERVKESLLRHGDRIRLGPGRVELIYLREEQGADPNTVSWPREGKSALQLTSAFPVPSSAHSDLEKISHLLDFQYHWEKSFSADRTFQQILDSALKISGAERGFILIRDGADFRYVVGMDGAGHLLSESEFQTSRSVVEQVACRGEPLFMMEGIDRHFARQESIVQMRLRALACLPLTWMSSSSESPAVQGILYLDSTRAMHTLSGLDKRIISKLAVEAANVFEKLEMLKTFEERKAFEKELALAQETQVALLPREIPRFKGFGVYAFSQPTRYVGGDFYDFLELDGNRLTGVLADVSGKGIAAALLSSFLQGALETECRTGEPLDRVLTRVNRHLCEKTQSNRFVTLFLVTLDGEGKGGYISAGHNPAYLYRAATQELDELPSRDLILGAFDFASYEMLPLELFPGDILVVYSDGVTDATNPEGEMFGEERLIPLIREFAGSGAGGLEDRILEGLEEFTRGRVQTDDVTFFLIERNPS